MSAVAAAAPTDAATGAAPAASSAAAPLPTTSAVSGDAKGAAASGGSGGGSGGGGGGGAVSAVLGLNALVIRSGDIDALRDWYALLGLSFAREKHGAGPWHYASVLPGGLVFEIYPLTKPKPTAAAPAPPAPVADATTRLSFAVSDLDALMALLTAAPDAASASASASRRLLPVSVVSGVRVDAFGRSAVVRDLDGRSVELVQTPTHANV